MALPEFLNPYATDFLNTYFRQVYGQDYEPGVGRKPLPELANLDQYQVPFQPLQQAGLQGISDTTGYAQSMGQAGWNQVGNTLQGQYLQDPTGGNQFLYGSMMPTAQGAYLNPQTNPWLQATYGAAARPMVENYQRSVMPGITAAAQRAGQMGGTAMNELYGQAESELGRGLNELGTNIYGGNYQAERARMAEAGTQGANLYNQAYGGERGRQMQAGTMVPGMQQAAYQPWQTLYGAGAQQQQQLQGESDVDYANRVARFEQPSNVLSGLGSAMLQAGGGGETKSTTTSKTTGGGSVICSEMFRQGLIDSATYEACGRYGVKVGKEVLRGYRMFGRYIARGMARSKLLSRLIAPIALKWASEMRARAEGTVEGRSWLGSAILGVMEPVSRWLGKRKVRPSPDFRKSILAVQEVMKQAGGLGPEAYPLTHHFTPTNKTYGCYQYARAIFVPKDTLVVGKIHKHAHLNFIMKGKVAVHTEYGVEHHEAPDIFVSKPGTKRAVYHVEDTIWVTVHLTGHQGEENLDKIEDEVIAKNYEELGEFLRLEETK